MIYSKKYVTLLQALIATPSYSREENATAALIENFLGIEEISFSRSGNNIWAQNKYFQKDLPTVLLNSHHDTVKPVQGWTHDPFAPDIVAGKLFGLGSNDAGASLVCLLAAFVHFYAQKNLKFNLIWVASAEEEISGRNGIESILSQLPVINVGIVGEPTQMQVAVAEKGLMVIDAKAHGKAGHAARNEGVNAIDVAMADIEKIKNLVFDRYSEWLSPNKLTVTQIKAGTQHNVVPDLCEFVIDVRTNDRYANQEVFDLLQRQLNSELTARSFRLNASSIPVTHPLVQRCTELGLKCFGSPTLSDQALMPFPTLKIGPGNSARSHTADEFIFLSEIEDAIEKYILILMPPLSLSVASMPTCINQE